MKKILAIVMALVMVFAMAACGNQNEAVNDGSQEGKGKIESVAETLPANVKDPANKETGNKVDTTDLKGSTENELSAEEIVETVIEMQGEPVEKLIEWLGEPQSKDYSSSCLVQGGQDGELVYDGFIVYTVVQADGTETVYDAVVE